MLITNNHLFNIQDIFSDHLFTQSVAFNIVDALFIFEIDSDFTL